MMRAKRVLAMVAVIGTRFADVHAAPARVVITPTPMVVGSTWRVDTTEIIDQTYDNGTIAHSTRREVIDHRVLAVDHGKPVKTEVHVVQRTRQRFLTAPAAVTVTPDPIDGRTYLVTTRTDGTYDIARDGIAITDAAERHSVIRVGPEGQDLFELQAVPPAALAVGTHVDIPGGATRAIGVTIDRATEREARLHSTLVDTGAGNDLRLDELLLAGLPDGRTRSVLTTSITGPGPRLPGLRASIQWSFTALIYGP